MLVVAEFALALTLLAGAGLVIHSFWKLTRVDLGFRRDHILTFTLPVSFDRFPHEEQITAFYRPLLEEFATLPGIKSAAASSEHADYMDGYGHVVQCRGAVQSIPRHSPTQDSISSPRLFSNVRDANYAGAWIHRSGRRWHSAGCDGERNIREEISGPEWIR